MAATLVIAMAMCSDGYGQLLSRLTNRCGNDCGTSCCDTLVVTPDVDHEELDYL